MSSIGQGRRGKKRSRIVEPHNYDLPLVVITHYSNHFGCIEKDVISCFKYYPNQSINSVPAKFTSRYNWVDYVIDLPRFKAMFSRFRIKSRYRILKSLFTLVTNIPSYLGKLQYLDFLSCLIPEYICTDTISGVNMAKSFHSDICVITSKTKEYGLNYVNILLSLRQTDRNKGGFPLCEEWWYELELSQRMGLAAASLLVAYEATDANRVQIIDCVLDNARTGRPWYLGPAQGTEYFDEFIQLHDFVVAGELRSYDDIERLRIIDLWRKTVVFSPLLDLWSRVNWSSFLVFVAHKYTNPDPVINLFGGRLIRHSVGGVPYWTVNVNQTPTRKILRKLFKCFPYTSEVDKRHMATNVGALVHTLLSGGWRGLYNQCYPLGPPACKAVVLNRLNFLLNLLPLGTYQILVLVAISSLAPGVPLDDPVFSYIDRHSILIQDPYHSSAALKSLSNCLRRCCLTPDGEKIDDQLVIRYAYWELAVGRSRMVSDWQEERRNRCSQTYHIHSKIDSDGYMKWRKDTVAYVDREQEFYEMFREEAQNILEQVIPKKVSGEPMWDFFQRRSEWMTSGSSAGESIILDEKTHKVNKRGWAETITLDKYIAHIKSLPPKEETVGSEKFENGKGRSIYGTKADHYMISSYATRGFEENLQVVEGLEKGMTGAAIWGAEAKRARISGDSTHHLTMLDYSDFNIQHTPEAQSILYEVCADIGESRGAPTDWIWAHRWLAKSKYNMQVTFPHLPPPDNQNTYHVKQGMFSGTRSTDLINTLSNLVYYRIAKKLAIKLFGEIPSDLYHVHQGDDVWISSKSPLWAAIIFLLMNQMGFVFNSKKQMFGNGRGEFLRVLSSHGSAYGYTGRALGNLFLRPIQNPVSLLPMEHLSSITNSLTTLARRGLSPLMLFALHHDLTVYWGKFRAFPGDPVPLVLPKSLMWYPPADGGYDCPPPFFSIVPRFCDLPQINLNLQADSIVAKLPGHMTDDWISYVSNKLGGEFSLRAKSLSMNCKAANYIDVIKAELSLRPFRSLKEQWRKTLKNHPNIRHFPTMIPYSDVDWYDKMGWDVNPNSFSVVNPPQKDRLPPKYLSDMIINLIHHPDLPPDAGQKTWSPVW